MVATEAYYQNTREEIFQYLDRSFDKHLDIGCGEGLFGKNAKSKKLVNFSAGIELDPESAKRAKNNLDEIYEGNVLDQLEQIKDVFDLVTFNDSLEHFIEPSQVLVKLKRILKPNSLVVASVPNLLHNGVMRKLIINNDFEYVESGVLDKTHLRFFTKKSLVRLFEDAEYKVNSVHGINGSWSLSAIVLTIWSFGLLKECKYLQNLIIASPG